jgi:nucleotide-binding universal stress UspA family protein
LAIGKKYRRREKFPVDQPGDLVIAVGMARAIAAWTLPLTTSRHPMNPCVLAAIDLGPCSSRVLLHAAGFARLWSVPLRILYVSPDPESEARRRAQDFCEAEAAFEIAGAEGEIIVRAGLVSEAIHREAVRQNARLIVTGSRAHAGLVRWLIGSTSQAVLRSAPAPVLIVPPADLDIVNIMDLVRLTCGPILAAIDLGENSDRQLAIAGDLAQQSGQPLLMMTVASRTIDDHAASEMLRQLAHEHAPVKPLALIVRRGNIAEEISRCAAAEDCGLVVMGLRAGERSAGAIASAVLSKNRAFVLAVPAA